MKGPQLLSARGLIRRFSPAVVSVGLRDRAAREGRAESSADDPFSLGRIGSLEVRLAASPAEVRRAQAIRYQVFYQEMAAIADLRAQHIRRDADAFDRVCDHLIVLDHASPRRGPLLRFRPELVGTYRLLRQEIAERHAGFYTAGEYEVTPLVARSPQLRFLELGRSCVTEPYRTRRTVELLWHGIWRYVLRHRVDVMIGCASLPGTDPAQLALPLSFLHHTALAPPEWRVHARGERRVEMNRMEPGQVDARTALKVLPPLIKGYLRLGAFVGDGAVVDHQFGTTDVCIVLPVSRIASRYVDHYGVDASRYS